MVRLFILRHYVEVVAPSICDLAVAHLQPILPLSLFRSSEHAMSNEADARIIIDCLLREIDWVLWIKRRSPPKRLPPTAVLMT
jgi:hypothetical protein